MYPTARQDKMLVQELGDELVVYDQESDRAHRLNRTAALVWRHCDGRTGVGALADLLRRELDLPPDEQVVRLALDRLERANLLRLPVAPAERTPRPRVSRRQVMRRLAMAGAASMLLPVVTSITAPTPAQAQTAPARCVGPDMCINPSQCVPKGFKNIGKRNCPLNNICCKFT